jgi:hypothetical protein
VIANSRMDVDPVGAPRRRTHAAVTLLEAEARESIKSSAMLSCRSEACQRVEASPVRVPDEV